MWEGEFGEGEIVELAIFMHRTKRIEVPKSFSILFLLGD
jgi:hypothetical protein